MTTKKIGLVEDHVLIREAIGNIIHSFDEFSISIMADNGKEFIGKLNPDTKPDVLLLDLNMPEMDGHATTFWLSKNYPDIKILILTMYDAESLIHMIKSGVRGFLKKDVSPGELRHALHCVLEDGTYYSQTITGRLFNLVRNSNEKKSGWGTVVLNESELSFLKLAASEFTYKEIAQKMQISPRTVDNYRDSLFIKLSVKSRVGLAMYAVRSGIANINF